MLAHRPPGIVGTYNLHEYEDEKAEALEAVGAAARSPSSTRLPRCLTKRSSRCGGGGDDGPADRGAWPPVRWRGLARCSCSPVAGGALYGFLMGFAYRIAQLDQRTALTIEGPGWPSKLRTLGLGALDEV